MIPFIKDKRFVYITLIVLSALFLISFSTYKLLEKELYITIDEKHMEVKTYSMKVEKLLEENNIILTKEDYINVSVDSPVKDNMEIVIRKAIPVTVKTYNKIVESKTAKETVGEVLESFGIEVDDNDKVIPGINEKVTREMEISITKIDEVVKVEKQEIPHDVVVKEDSSILKGKVVTLYPGKNGIKEVKVKEIYENGELKSKEILDENIIEEPVREIVAKGTKDYLVTSRGDLGYRKSLVMTATAYDLSYESTGKRPGDKGYGITATGTRARPGVVAVDPKVIPLGTKLYIKSLDGSKDYGFAIAEDTGSAIKGNRIDLFFESRDRALSFGRRRVMVYILE